MYVCIYIYIIADLVEHAEVVGPADGHAHDRWPLDQYTKDETNR